MAWAKRASVALPLAMAGLLPGHVAAQASGPDFLSFRGFTDSKPFLPPGAPRADRPTYNFSGVAGLVDLPSAHMPASGDVAFTYSAFGGINRATLTFQVSSRLSASFRYSRFLEATPTGTFEFFDRSFDVRYLLIREGDWRPAVVVGLRDFAGTGRQAAEFIVATKQVSDTLRITGGLGWGRLAGESQLGSPFGDRPVGLSGLGGQLESSEWFRGPVSPFGGFEWRPTDRLNIKAEYSPDLYELEESTGEKFDRRGPINAGIEYYVGGGISVGGYYLYGNELGFKVTTVVNPRQSAAPLRFPVAPHVEPRPDRATNPELWAQTWKSVEGVEDQVVEVLTTLFEEEGQTLLGLELTAVSARVLIENNRYDAGPNAVGRVARAMARVLPPSVENFEIVFSDKGLELSTVTINRTSLEESQGRPDQAEALLASTTFSPPLPADSIEGIYPRFDYSLGPAFRASFFDPSEPIRAEVTLQFAAQVELTRGLVLLGVLDQPIAGNIDDSPVTPSLLPAVRTTAPLYSSSNSVRVSELTLSYGTYIGNNVYGRATAGLFEQAFGGVAGELLWKPVNSRLALGAELAYVQQRDFDQRFTFQDFDVVTGHASLYYNLYDDFLVQIDVGRYLAGDEGATLTLERTFANGWKVGGFATITNVSAEEFGEGSFDKGIIITVPLTWVSGRPSTRVLEGVVRPILRDGGARLKLNGRLYDRIAPLHQQELEVDWGRVWR